MLGLAKDQVLRAVSSNLRCQTGVLAENYVFTCEMGPSGGPELLAMLHADDRFGDRFWYGHILKSPDKESYVALIVWSHRFINAATVRLLFRRFHYWTDVDPQFEPCTIQHCDDAYAQCTSFREAVEALSKMIVNFDADSMSGLNNMEPQQCMLEMRIFSVYGSQRLWTDQDEKIGPPSDPKLTVVEDSI